MTNTVEEYLSHNYSDVFIIITCSVIEDVIEQLNAIHFFDNSEAAVADFILFKSRKKKEMNRNYPETFRLTKQQCIPKKIHYCWFGGHPIPEKYTNWMSSWRKYCPDYEIIEWNERNYDVSKSTFMLESYKAQKWGFVTDYVRLDVIYNHGGIYLDTDVELIKPLDELLFQDAFSGVEANNLVASGLGFGAIKGHKMIYELLNYYTDKHFDSYNTSAVPVATKNIYKKHGYIENGEYQVINGMTIYPEKVLAGKDQYTGIIAPTEHTFAIHHYDASWCDEKIKEHVKTIR